MFKFNDSLQGTEIVAKQFLKEMDLHKKEIESYNWILVPGIATINDDKNIAWIHLNETEEGLGWIEDPRVKNFVFVSNYQYQRFFEIYDISKKNCAVIKNAIYPIEDHVKPQTDKIKLVYTSDTVRGADVAILAMDYLSHMEDIELHIYGEIEKNDPEWRISEQEQIKSMASLDDRVFIHGMVDHERIIQALKSSHMYVYPSKWRETSCISLIEALSAGCYCITSNIGALSETGLGFNVTYSYSSDLDTHAKRLAKEIEKGISAIKSNTFNSKDQRSSINKYYSWETRTREWKEFLKSIDNDSVN